MITSTGRGRPFIRGRSLLHTLVWTGTHHFDSADEVSLLLLKSCEAMCIRSLTGLTSLSSPSTVGYKSKPLAPCRRCSKQWTWRPWCSPTSQKRRTHQQAMGTGWPPQPRPQGPHPGAPGRGCRSRHHTSPPQPHSRAERFSGSATGAWTQIASDSSRADRASCCGSSLCCGSGCCCQPPSCSNRRCHTGCPARRELG